MLVELRGPTELAVSDFAESGAHVHGDAGGEGFGPLQMFAASVGLCSAAVLEEYARGPLATDTRNLRLLVRWRYADHPHRVASLDIEVSWPELAPEDRPAVERAIETCAIHRTLEHPPALSTRVAAGEEREAAPPAAPAPGPAEPESMTPPMAREAELPISEATKGRAR